MYTTCLPPQHLLTLSRKMVLRYPLLPSPVQLHRPFPYLHHSMSTKASQPCHLLTTHTPLVKSLKASTFLSPHQIKPPPVECETPSPWVSRLPSPLRKLLLPPLISSLPPYPLSFPLSTSQTPWRHPVHLTSKLRLLLIHLSTAYFIQVRHFPS
jgi:hypothetical protein